MTMQDWKTRILGRAAAALLAAFLVASGMAAISRGGNDRQRALQETWLLAMDVYAQTYGDANWSEVAASLVQDPAGPANPQVMSVFLSLGNVYLNRFEQGHSTGDLDRSLAFFEVVAGNEQVWGKRSFAGSVVAYLGVGLIRLEAHQCELGEFRGRVEDLRLRVNEVAGAEADAVADLEEFTGSLVETTPEEDAARVELYCAASNLLPEHPRAGFWEQNAVSVAARLLSMDSWSTETTLALSQAELLYELSGKEVPAVFEGFASQRGIVVPFRDPLPIVIVERIEPIGTPADLVEAVRESRAVAAMLTVYLRQFPPGSACVGKQEPDIGPAQ